MNRIKENEELIHDVNKATSKLKSLHGSDEAIAKVYSNLNTYILLDISRSLAVIADKMTYEDRKRAEEEETE